MDLKALSRELRKIQGALLLPGREEEARVLMLSLISRHHVVLIGPRGTAKSLLISRLAKMFSVPYFEYQLSKYTMPEELLGVPNVKLLREQGVYKLITAGKLPEAVLAFLDEIFKGSSAILNALLTILNERKFFDGTQMVKCPLWTAMGASNEVPEEPELAAFYDRFQYRVFVQYLPPERWEELLQAYWVTHQPGYQKTLPSFDFNVIKEAFNALWSVDVFAVKKQLLEIFMKLRDQGIEISDRRKGRCLITLAASAVLDGRATVTPADLLALKYTIPETADQVKVVEQVIIDVAGKQLKLRQQLSELIPQLRGLIEELERAQSFEEALKVAEKLKPIHAKWSELSSAAQGLEEAEEVRRLLNEFNELLVKKVRV